jgi:hypothetical protein
MSDPNFKTMLIQDARIANITDIETFCVMDGASQSTFQNFTATSQSNSSIVFNIQIPSENIVIDRHLLMQSTITLNLTLGGTIGIDASTNSQNILVFDYGLTDSLQVFPLNSLCTTQQMSINNATVSQNTKDILPMLLRLYDRRKLNRYNSMCPSLPDSYYAEYKSGLGCLNNVLAGYNNQTLDEDFVPRGAFPIKIKNVIHKYVYSVMGVATTYYDNSLVMIAGTTGNTWSIVIQFETTEPFICLPPWTNTNSNNQAGLVGVNNLSCNFNIDATCSRVFSTMNDYITNIELGATAVAMSTPDYANPATVTITNPSTGAATNYTAYTGTPIPGTATPIGFEKSQLLFNFLSLQPEQYKKISSKNCIPYLDFPRYLSSQQSTTSIASGASSSLTSQSLQLNQIPDLLLICVRKPMSSQNWTDTSSFLTIDKISISFNNTSGILSSAYQQQLFNISYRNGSSQSFYEFAGSSRNNYSGSVNADGTISYSQDLVGRGVTVGTTGSLLVLNPVYDFNLPAYLSASSLGQYNLYFTITVTNQYASTIQNPEIVVVTINSGIFTTQLGSSVINTGILTKEDVLKAKDQKPTLDSVDYKRYVGGNLSNMGMSNLSKVCHHIKSLNDDHVAEEQVPSAGAMSGGRVNRLKKHIR